MPTTLLYGLALLCLGTHLPAGCWWTSSLASPCKHPRCRSLSDATVRTYSTHGGDRIASLNCAYNITTQAHEQGLWRHILQPQPSSNVAVFFLQRNAVCLPREYEAVDLTQHSAVDPPPPGSLLPPLWSLLHMPLTAACRLICKATMLFAMKCWVSQCNACGLHWPVPVQSMYHLHGCPGHWGMPLLASCTKTVLGSGLVWRCCTRHRMPARQAHMYE
jgi:hypothetical protein